MTDSPNGFNPKPGDILENIPAETYHSGPGVSSSTLKRVLRSPAHSLIPIQPNAAMAVGSAFHLAMELGEEWRQSVSIKPDGFDGRTKAGKAWKAEAEAKGLPIIGEADANSVEGMVNEALDAQITDSLTVADVLKGAHFERSHYSQDSETGELIKVRPDVMREDLNLIIDWKTTDDARPETFSRRALNFGMDLSAALYLDTTRADMFVWVVVERNPPFGVCSYFIDETDAVCQRGRDHYRQALNLYHHCMTVGDWPGYDPRPLRLTLPRWAE